MTEAYEQAYAADRSISGKIRRRLTRLAHRRPVRRRPEHAMLTISFDDAPMTATETGAEILGRHGVVGTYYVAAGLAGKRAPMGTCGGPEDYIRLAGRGHEIACHTFSHLDCAQATGSHALEDVDRNASAFRDWGLAHPESFAYPYGDIAPLTKAALANRFTSLRALHAGLISAGSDLNQAPAVGIEGPAGEDVARRWLHRARDKSAWLVLYTHDVDPSPSPWGCTPGALDRLIGEAIEDGFEVITMREGVARLSS